MAAWSLHELSIARKPDLMRDLDDWLTEPKVRLDELRRAGAAVAGVLARQGVDDGQIPCRSGEPGRPDRSGKLQRVATQWP